MLWLVHVSMPLGFLFVDSITEHGQVEDARLFSIIHESSLGSIGSVM